MKPTLFVVLVGVGIGLIGLASSLPIVAAGPAADRVTCAPSHYVPAKDLVGQLHVLVDHMHSDLATEDEYESGQQQRVARDANTVAVIALVLAKHDQSSQVKKGAKGVIDAALAVAENADQFATANKALASLDEALKSETSDDISWHSVGDIEQLMLQVPKLNSSLRRGVNGRRFAKSRDKAVGLAAALAAIAQVSAFDDTYCSDEADEAKWVKYCVEMRDAAGGVNMAIHRGDQEGAKSMLKTMTRACDDCHAHFRGDE